MKLNISNSLTLSRIAMVPFFAYFLYNSQWTYAFILLFLAWLTDILDGYLARKLNQETQIGRALDPAADKIFFAVSITVLILGHALPLYYFIILTRDVLIGFGSLGILAFSKHRKKMHFSATFFGKAVTGFQVAGVALMILQIMGKIPESYVSICILLAFITSIICIIQYTHKFLSGNFIKEE